MNTGERRKQSSPPIRAASILIVGEIMKTKKLVKLGDKYLMQMASSFAGVSADFLSAADFENNRIQE